MTVVAKKIAREALSLRSKDRAWLAHQLIESLEETRSADDLPPDITPAEIERRVDEIEGGKVLGIPAEEAYATVRAKLRARR